MLLSNWYATIRFLCMKFPSVSMSKLISYIKNNEVVYQVYCDLVEVSNENNSQNRDFLLENFKHVSSVKVLEKGDSYIHESFEELDNWAKADDVLFLLEPIGILICIPCYLALQNKLIFNI